MTKVIAHTYTIAHEYRRQITVALLATCVVCAIFYAINLFSLVSSTVTLRQVTAEANALNATLDGLDARYVEISGSITPDALRSHGYGESKVSAFIPRTTSLGRATLSGYDL